MWSLLLVFHMSAYQKTVTSITGFLDKTSCTQAGEQIQKDFPYELIEFDCVKVFK